MVQILVELALLAGGLVIAWAAARAILSGVLAVTFGGAGHGASR